MSNIIARLEIITRPPNKALDTGGNLRLLLDQVTELADFTDPQPLHPAQALRVVARSWVSSFTSSPQPSVGGAS